MHTGVGAARVLAKSRSGISISGGSCLTKADDLHAKGLRVLGDSSSNGAQPDDAQDLAVHLGASEGLALPLALAHRNMCGRDLAQHGRHERDGQLRGSASVAPGGVHHNDAVASGSQAVDVVDTDARTAHNLRGSGRGTQQMNLSE